MKIATVMKNLSTFFNGLSWTSDDGTGTTSFNGVYTYPNWSNDDGYPFVVLLDESGAGSSIDNRNVEMETVISVNICVNYAIIDKQSDDEKVEEAMLRLREAYDYVKEQLFKYTTMTSLGIDWNMDPAFVDDYDSELNLYKRTITLIVKETINRG